MPAATVPLVSIALAAGTLGLTAALGIIPEASLLLAPVLAPLAWLVGHSSQALPVSEATVSANEDARVRLRVDAIDPRIVQDFEAMTSALRALRRGRDQALAGRQAMHESSTRAHADKAWLSARRDDLAALDHQLALSKALAERSLIQLGEAVLGKPDTGATAELTEQLRDQTIAVTSAAVPTRRVSPSRARITSMPSTSR